MSAEQNSAYTGGSQEKGIIRRYVEESLNSPSLVDQMVAPGAVFHGLPDSDGPEGQKRRIDRLNTACPDGHFSIEDLIAEGDKVVARWTFRGTHRGEYFGIPPTGKQVALTGITIYGITVGKIQEAWTNLDALGLMQQLGVIPSGPS
jgi:steroid delta-isomerase-like uncharacterized protein